MTMDTLKLLTDAREIISRREHWAQNDFAYDATGKATNLLAHNAHSFCALGALRLAGYRNGFECSESSRAQRMIELVISPESPYLETSVSDYNDSHTHEEVLAVFDKAISLCEIP